MTLIKKLINEHNQAVQYAEESPEKDGFLSGMKKAIDIVKNHNSWISVDDRLPPLETVVLVYQIPLRYVLTATYLGDSWEFSELMPSDTRVTHWQPLPEDPKEY